MFMEWFFPIFTEYSKNNLTTIQIVFTNGVISIIVTILVAGIMLVFIEEPFNKLKNKLTS
jgi:peptidoglycan/LPS O-acetylase OafA/YrhL